MVNPNLQVVQVIDDDSGTRGSLKWLLEGQNLAVTTHDSGPAFLSHYAGQPGCIVADFRMPGMTGLELQTALLDRGIELPLILVTAYADVTVCRTALLRGAVDLIEKPIDNRLLLERVDEALGLDRQRRSEAVRRQKLSQKVAALTPREAEVMQRLAQGATLKEIALSCGIGFQTAAKHRVHLLDKLGVRGDVELVRLLVCSDES